MKDKRYSLFDCLLTIMAISFIVISIFFIIDFSVRKNSKTPEEIKQEQIAQEEYEFNHTYHFPVISVFRYIKTNTSRYGDIIDQEVRYSFIWLDADGNTHQTDDYIHIDIGPTDEFVVRDYFGGWTSLYLTEDTVKNLNHK